MSINYIIATYSGIQDNGVNKHHVLHVQLDCLYKILRKKKSAGEKSLIGQITVVCPRPSEPGIYHDYYQENLWRRAFKDLVPIQYVEYIGTSAYKQYDQWLQGYIYSSGFDYNIFIADDYCIDEANTNFDEELIIIYKSIFPDNVGYLCALKDKSYNGFVSSETLEKCDIYDFYEAEGKNPREKFVKMFTTNGIEIKDDYKHYYQVILFRDGKIVDLSLPNKRKVVFYPVQSTGLYTRI